MNFVWKHTSPRKSKPPFQFWLAFIWVLSEIPLDNANWSNLFNFDPFLNRFRMKSDKTRKIEATFSILTRFRILFVWNHTRQRKSKQPFQFWLVLECFLHAILPDHENRSNLFNFDSFLNVFAWNPTRPRKSKQHVQILPVSQWFLYKILPNHAYRSNLFNFHPFFNCFFRKSYWTTQIEATFSILTHYWIVLYHILPDYSNPSNLLNFDPFLNGFCMKSYQTTQIEATFSILTRFWMLFLWNRSRPRKSKPPFQFWLAFIWFLYVVSPRRLKQPLQFWLVFEWFLYESTLDHANWSNLFYFDPFFNGFCMKAH